MILATTPVAAGPLSGAERTAVLEAARAPIAGTLGRPVRFVVDRLERRGDWAFLWARLVDGAGRPVSYAGTPLANAEREGMVSKSAAVLLKRDNGRWTVVDQAIGPTDVAWEGWAARHGAPAELFN